MPRLQMGLIKVIYPLSTGIDHPKISKNIRWQVKREPLEHFGATNVSKKHGEPIKELQIEFTNWHLHFTHGVWGRSHGVFSESPNLVAPCRCQLLKATSYVMPHLLHANPSSCWSVIFCNPEGIKTNNTI